VAKYFDISQGGVGIVERKWRNNGIPDIEKEIINSAEVYGAEKALQLLNLKRVVDEFVKEREKNGP
jgi:hypothetical protein